MFEPIGRSVPLSLARRVVCDFLDVSTTVPTVSIQKSINVADVAVARHQAAIRPSWSAIFTKAYAKGVAAHPELRRAFLTFPWQRIYEYHATKADIVMEATIDAEAALVTVPIANPESLPLLEIDRILAWCKEDPVERVAVFRHAMILARFPAFIRRLLMRFVLNGYAPARADYFGTFGVTSLGNWGIESLRPLSPWTTLLHYGVIDAQNNITMRLTYDHRLLDGSGPARALNEMEQFLQTEILPELQALPRKEDSHAGNATILG